MKKIILNLILFITISSCVLTENSFDEKSFYIKMTNINSIRVIAGNSEMCDSLNSVYKINFDKVRGGSTFLFGKKIRDVSNGFTTKRLLINSTGKVREYSINDILKLKFYKKDTLKIFILDPQLLINQN